YSWEFNLANELSAQPGEFYGLVSVRDEICNWLDGTTPPYGVKQDASTVDYRDFATYQSFKIEIPGLDGIFQADSHRRNLDIVTGIIQPTSADTSLDIAVVENDDSDINGVYMPDANRGVTRYTHDYSEAEFHGPGFLPINDTGTHPDPTTAMPLRRLDANSKGVTGAGYMDANETYFPFDPDPPILPAGNIFHLSYCVIPPPQPPFGSKFPLDRFAGYFMADTDDPQTPSVNEYEDEDPMPIDIWDDFNGDLGCVWETTKLVNISTGNYDILYFGVSLSYAANPLNPPTPTVEFSGSLTGIPAGDLKGVDKSDNGYIYYAFSGQDTYDAWNYNSLLAGLDANNPSGNPMIGGIPVYSGNVIDMELLPYNDSMPRIINGIRQTAPIAVCLTDSKTIEFIDSITGQVLQIIDGSADGSIAGVPKHLDVGDTSFTVHVTHLQDSTPRVTVYILK
ncbi:hypothetical protein KKB99_00445, partial [bacterium]|nr:hypothetical protein [bacterium]MBU1024454.1 hypothetical protein [bacterium]